MSNFYGPGISASNDVKVGLPKKTILLSICFKVHRVSCTLQYEQSYYSPKMYVLC